MEIPHPQTIILKSRNDLMQSFRITVVIVQPPMHLSHLSLLSKYHTDTSHASVSTTRRDVREQESSDQCATTEIRSSAISCEWPSCRYHSVISSRAYAHANEPRCSSIQPLMLLIRSDRQAVDSRSRMGCASPFDNIPSDDESILS